MALSSVQNVFIVVFQNGIIPLFKKFNTAFLKCLKSGITKVSIITGHDYNI